MDAERRRANATRGGLLLRDGATFLILSCVTIALFSFTLFLFRSFEERREDLGREWSSRGREALKNRQPGEAVAALRNALSYDPNERTDQLLLAQALAEAGKTEEATSYFLNLHEARPGDGFVNLQLARLARRAGDAPEAINDYRASIFGTWEGDGIVRRREVRLELADYLAHRGDVAAARAELLIAVGNAPEDQGTETMLGDRLAGIGDFGDALGLYFRALARNPHDGAILARAGRTEYATGQYTQASTLLTEAAEPGVKNPPQPEERAQLAAQAAMAKRLTELRLTRDLPATERADHLVNAATIARERLRTCSAQLAPPTDAGTSERAGKPLPASLLFLQDRWAASGVLNRRTLERNATLEDEAMRLIDDSELQTATVCGHPTGDDALLLMLASGNHREAL